MKIIDITQPIRPGMVVWPGDRGVTIEVESDIRAGADSHVTRIALGMHTGTHLDAPMHFEPDGISVEQIDLSVLIGPARVFHLPDCPRIEKADLDRLDLDGCERVLFRTSNGARYEQDVFCRDFVALSPDAAAHLADRGVKLVGVDYLSVEPFQNDGWATHHALLRRGVIPLEGLDLRHVEPGDYQLIALPMLIEGAEGAPVRAVLTRPDP
jgi:arylformamidase